MNEPQLILAKSASLYNQESKKIDNSYDNLFNEPNSSSLDYNKNNKLLDFDVSKNSESINSFNY